MHHHATEPQMPSTSDAKLDSLLGGALYQGPALSGWQAPRHQAPGESEVDAMLSCAGITLDQALQNTPW